MAIPERCLARDVGCTVIRLVPAIHVVAGFTKCECNSEDSYGVALFTGSFFFLTVSMYTKSWTWKIKVNK